MRDHQLCTKFSKCDFYKDQIQYLGHVIFVEGISVDPENIKTIMECLFPANVVDIRYFMGLVGYYQHFIEGFSKIVYLITTLHKKGKTFIWTVEC